MEFKKPVRSNTPEAPRRIASDTPQTAAPQVASGETKLSQLLLAILKEKTTLAIIAGVLIVIGVITTLLVIINQKDASSPTAATDKTRQETKEKPKYETVLPKDKSINTLGGWTRVSPPNNDPVYAYLDKIGETPVSVSEQPLPESFKGDVDGQLAELAKKFNATTKLEAGDITTYLGTSAKGPQSVIFVKGELLILIKSQNKIDTKDWTSYVQSLN